jgi:hypothetical protein
MVTQIANKNSLSFNDLDVSVKRIDVLFANVVCSSSEPINIFLGNGNYTSVSHSGNLKLDFAATINNNPTEAILICGTGGTNTNETVNNASQERPLHVDGKVTFDLVCLEKNIWVCSGNLCNSGWGPVRDIEREMYELSLLPLKERTEVKQHRYKLQNMANFITISGNVTLQDSIKNLVVTGSFLNGVVSVITN